MKTRLSHKLFAAFLLTSVGLVAVMAVSVQYFAARNFTRYVNQSEQSRLLVLAGDAIRLYREEGGWERVRQHPNLWGREVNNRDANPGAAPWGALGPDRERDAPQDRPAPPEDRRPRSEEAGTRPPREVEPLPDREEGGGHPVSPEKPPSDRRPGGVSLLDEQGGLVAGPALTLENSNHQPVLDGGKVVGWVAVPLLEKPQDPIGLEFLSRQTSALYLTGVAILLFAVAASFFLSRHFLSPIRRLAAGTAAMGQRRFDTRLPVATQDELGKLAADFNSMAETLEDRKSVV